MTGEECFYFEQTDKAKSESGPGQGKNHNQVIPERYLDFLLWDETDRWVYMENWKEENPGGKQNGSGEEARAFSSLPESNVPTHQGMNAK